MNNDNIKHFEILNKIDVSQKIEKKKIGEAKLAYLSWTWAWAELKKQYPYAIYKIEKFNGLPYVFDPLTGYIVYTNVTIENITHEMWLPVMDGANKTMKDKPYEYTTKLGTKTCEAATMFDINKTIMRCLVKNIAMFGLGLYIFAGEDLPEEEKEEKLTKQTIENNNEKITAEQLSNLNEIIKMIENNKIPLDKQKMLEHYKIKSFEDILQRRYPKIELVLKNKLQAGLNDINKK